jgi:uncharacterized membrane-anchored protein YhcB (DUF1043 family)
MTPFTPDQWIMLGLVFLLGLLVGLFLMAGRRWRRLYNEEVRRNQALEAEIEQLRRDAREMESLRHAATKTPGAEQTTSHDSV